MKNSKVCLKCNSEELKVISALPVQVYKGVLPHHLSPSYYVCTECGYTEVWMDSKEELEYIKGNQLG